jgi:hypothetical protein
LNDFAEMHFFTAGYKTIFMPYSKHPNSYEKSQSSSHYSRSNYHPRYTPDVNAIFNQYSNYQASRFHKIPFDQNQPTSYSNSNQKWSNFTDKYQNSHKLVTNGFDRSLNRSLSPSQSSSSSEKKTKYGTDPAQMNFSNSSKILNDSQRDLTGHPFMPVGYQSSGASLTLSSPFSDAWPKENNGQHPFSCSKLIPQVSATTKYMSPPHSASISELDQKSGLSQSSSSSEDSDDDPTASCTELSNISLPNTSKHLFTTSNDLPAVADTIKKVISWHITKNLV